LSGLTDVFQVHRSACQVFCVFDEFLMHGLVRISLIGHWRPPVARSATCRACLQIEVPKYCAENPRQRWGLQAQGFHSTLILPAYLDPLSGTQRFE